MLKTFARFQQRDFFFSTITSLESAFHARGFQGNNPSLETFFETRQQGEALAPTINCKSHPERGQLWTMVRYRGVREKKTVVVQDREEKGCAFISRLLVAAEATPRPLD